MGGGGGGAAGKLQDRLVAVVDPEFFGEGAAARPVGIEPPADEVVESIVLADTGQACDDAGLLAGQLEVARLVAGVGEGELSRTKWKTSYVCFDPQPRRATP